MVTAAVVPIVLAHCRVVKRRGYHDIVSPLRNLQDLAAAATSAIGRIAAQIWRRLRKPVLILIGGIVLVMLLIVILQSGLGVDSDDTITDSHRPEIVGGGE